MYEQYPAHCPFATRCKCGFKIAAIVNKKKGWEELSAIEGSGFDAIMDKDNQSKENPAESWYRWIFSKVIRLEEPIELEPSDASDLNASRSFDIEFPLEKLPPIMFQDMCLSGIPPTSTVPFRTKK